MPILSIVSPVHCEEKGVQPFLDRVEAALAPLALSFEVILVDDGSTDATWNRILEEAVGRPWLRGLRLSRNFGKEAALAAGIDAACGAAVITLDSDLQHPPELMQEMTRLWLDGTFDVVEAQKEKRQKESFFSGLFARLFYALCGRLLPFDLEGASDFKLMDRKAVEAWKSMGERRLFFRGMSSWLGFRRKSLLFSPPERESGVSRWSFSSKLVLALDSLSAYTARPIGLIWVVGLLFGLFALLVGGEALWTEFRGKAVTGFTTVILLVLITGASIMGALCLLSLYLRQIFHEVKDRPRYLVSESLPGAQVAGIRWKKGMGRYRSARLAQGNKKTLLRQPVPDKKIARRARRLTAR